MFKSLKGWLDVPVSIKPFSSQDGTGDKTYGAVISTKCYPVAKTETITNKRGVEVVSSTQLYLDGSEVVTDHDVIIFEGVEREVQSILTYYKNGKADMKVVYL